jgi:hypothetical protein
MSCNKGVLLASAAIFVTVSCIAVPAFAQIDLSGQWQAINQSDVRTRIPGPDLADYTGIPLNDAGRAVALSYSYSTISMPERMCMDWSEDYITFAPHSIVIDRDYDPVTGDVLAWKISAGGSDRAPIPIWMDGRSHPSPNDLHTFGGFTTGQWEGAMLTAHMTHMKRGLSARNGAPLSDRATMTLHFTRHGDLLTIMTVTKDPIYLEAPLVQSGTYRLDLAGNTAPTNPPCYPLTEVPRLDVPGTVPHFLPGTNPDVQVFAKRHNLPLDAALGGAETLYPEYRKKLKDRYTPPPPCKIKDFFLLDCVPVP